MKTDPDELTGKEETGGDKDPGVKRFWLNFWGLIGSTLILIGCSILVVWMGHIRDSTEELVASNFKATETLVGSQLKSTETLVESKLKSTETLVETKFDSIKELIIDLRADIDQRFTRGDKRLDRHEDHHEDRHISDRATPSPDLVDSVPLTAEQPVSL